MVPANQLKYFLDVAQSERVSDRIIVLPLSDNFVCMMISVIYSLLVDDTIFQEKIVLDHTRENLINYLKKNTVH